MYYRHGLRRREDNNTKNIIGATRKSMIIRNRSKGIKLLIKYNTVFIGESSLYLTSYLGVLIRTQVPIKYNT